MKAKILAAGCYRDEVQLSKHWVPRPPGVTSPSANLAGEVAEAPEEGCWPGNCWAGFNLA